jgi:hypothetical protein
MNQSYCDAVIFKPKRNVLFYGFGLMSSYNSVPVKYTINWAINDQKGEEFNCDFEDSEKDPEKKWYTIDFRNYGIKPIKVNEGEAIHCIAKVRDDESRRCFYGYSGYRDRYSSI